jgi:hypothetical protein
MAIVTVEGQSKSHEAELLVRKRKTRQKPEVPDKVSIVASTATGGVVVLELEQDEAMQLCEDISRIVNPSTHS